MQQLSGNTLLLRSTDWSTKNLVHVADESCVRWQDGFITSRSPDKILIQVTLCYKADLLKRTTRCKRFKVGIGMMPNVCTMWKQRTIVPTE